jgi:hypothetical protein
MLHVRCRWPGLEDPGSIQLSAISTVENLGLGYSATPPPALYFCMSLTNIIDLMNIKYTQSVLDKLESIAEHSGYVLRYERGTFQSGYCILEQKKVVVLNKFLQIEGRINTLIDLLPQLDINPDFLPDDVKKLYLEIQANLVTVDKKDQ